MQALQTVAMARLSNEMGNATVRLAEAQNECERAGNIYELGSFIYTNNEKNIVGAAAAFLTAHKANAGIPATEPSVQEPEVDAIPNSPSLSADSRD